MWKKRVLQIGITAVSACYLTEVCKAESGSNSAVNVSPTTKEWCKIASNDVHVLGKPKTLHDAIQNSRVIIRRLKAELGLPGCVVGVSVNGTSVWEEGFGVADLENDVPCTPRTIMRIASISKAITMAAVARLWEEGKLDYDKPIQEYVPYFPEKSYNGEKVTITTRQLVSHMAGIRHYHTEKKGTTLQITEKTDNSGGENDVSTTQSVLNRQPEYFIKEKYDSVEDSIKLFKDDPLVHKPGSSFLYTTHGWTLISAVVEGAAKLPFPKYIVRTIKDLGMKNTCLDENDKLIFHRSRYYMKNDEGHLVNAPYVDNSYKWAGGGILSNVGDLLHFGNAMLYSFQWKEPKTNQSHAELHKITQNNESTHKVSNCNANNIAEITQKNLPGYLKKDTVVQLWTGVEAAIFKNDEDTRYGMGWKVSSYKPQYLCCRSKMFHTHHSGAAIGASSVLLIRPHDVEGEQPPQGVVVAIIGNLQEVRFTKHAAAIADEFASVTQLGSVL